MSKRRKSGEHEQRRLFVQEFQEVDTNRLVLLIRALRHRGVPGEKNERVRGRKDGTGGMVELRIGRRRERSGRLEVGKLEMRMMLPKMKMKVIGRERGGPEIKTATENGRGAEVRMEIDDEIEGDMRMVKVDDGDDGEVEVNPRGTGKMKVELGVAHFHLGGHPTRKSINMHWTIY